MHRDSARGRGWVVLAAAAAAVVSLPAVAVADTPTFSKDVAPILWKNCTTCHRSGEIGPMSLTSFAEARPWARAIRQAVTSRAMPPWGADPAVGHFANDPRLSRKDVDTIAAWADAGAPEGDPRALPAPPAFATGWQNYAWVHTYVLAEPIAVPKGSRLETLAHFDNSAANRNNPDPTARVKFGPEILNAYFEYTLDAQDLTRGSNAPR